MIHKNRPARLQVSNVSVVFILLREIAAEFLM